MKTRISVGLATALMLAASPAFACKGSKVLFSDDFKQVDSSWGFDSPDVQVEEGKVKVKPQPDISNLLIYKGILFGDADYCITVRTPNLLSDHDNTMAGPIFWAKDYDNYYMFMITPSGFAELTRKVGGKWIDVVEWKQDANINAIRARRTSSRSALRGPTSRRSSTTTFSRRSKVRLRTAADRSACGRSRRKTRSIRGSSRCCLSLRSRAPLSRRWPTRHLHPQPSRPSLLPHPSPLPRASLRQRRLHPRPRHPEITLRPRPACGRTDTHRSLHRHATSPRRNGRGRGR